MAGTPLVEHPEYAYDANATAAMPSPEHGYSAPDDDFDATRDDLMRVPDEQLVGDFEGMRRKPRHSKQKLIKIGAVAAAVVVVGGGASIWAMTGDSGPAKQSAAPSQQAQAQAQAQAPAPLTDAQRKDAAAERRKELKQRASRAARNEVIRPQLFAKGSPRPTPKPSIPGAGDPTPVGEAQKIARKMLPSFGWSPSSQFGCLVNLWNRESHWNTHAANPSGAYGIPQALPGSKMSSAGPNWQDDAHTQIKWGFGYIKDRYDSPCGAWSHSQSTGWY